MCMLKEQQLKKAKSKKERLLLVKGQQQKARQLNDPFEQQKQQLKDLLDTKRQTAPDSQEYFRLADQYDELLNYMVDNGLDSPIEDELLDEDLLSDKYLEFEKQWNKAHPYTIEQFIEEKCSFICLAEILNIESNTAYARVIRQYKGELPGDIRIKFFVPWGLSKWYRDGERAIVFLNDELVNLGLLGRMPIIERNGIEYAVSYNENPGFWPKTTQLKQGTLNDERVLLIELRQVETIINKNKQKSEASQKYELGRSYLNLFLKQFTKDSLDFLKKASEYFSEAKDLDENLAEAHSGLAACAIVGGLYNIAPPEESFAKALEPARKALAINDRLAEAHTSLAYAYMCYKWDWSAAESEYKKALEIDPDYALARQGLAHWLGAMERFEEALTEIDRALEIEPKSLMINVVRGFILYYEGEDYEESWKQFLKTRKLDPRFDATYYGLALACEPLALAYMDKGESEEAKKMFDKAEWAARRAVRLSHGNPVKIAAQAHVHALSGEEDKARQELQQLIALSTVEYVSPFQIATIYAAMVTTCPALENSNQALEYYEQALKYLEKAYKTRDQWIVLLNVEPRFTILHEDERFKKLIRNLDFPTDMKTSDNTAGKQANYQTSSEPVP